MCRNAIISKYDKKIRNFILKPSKDKKAECIVYSYLVWIVKGDMKTMDVYPNFMQSPRVATSKEMGNKTKSKKKKITHNRN